MSENHHRLPVFLDLAGRDVLLVGGGSVALSKLRTLVDAGARVRVVAPAIASGIDALAVTVARRPFVDADLDGAWLVVTAATPAVNREVAVAAEARRVFVNAVDDPANASAFLSGTIRRDGMTLAISTGGAAPALTALVREALDAVLPADLGEWASHARTVRQAWRRDLVPMPERKPLLLSALNELYDRRRRANRTRRPHRTAAGHVSLVGAGPGDPGLLTRRALAALRSADLVLYDALIDDRILRYARKAQRFFVGKRSGRQALSQEIIHRVMIRAARRGRRVVRLKGGDPFVFGRGGEEAMALAEAGIAYDMVPGVTSVVAAPELAGVPLTYRGRASAFVVLSGHDHETFEATVRALPPHGLTLVVLMGLAQATWISETLTRSGWSPDIPAAIVVNASMPEQRVWRGSLGELGSGAQGLATGGPGTIVIGEVVDLGAHRTASVALRR